MEHLRIVALGKATWRELGRQQVGGGARESDAPSEEQVTAEFLPACRELHLLELHRAREDAFEEVVAHDLRLAA